MRAKDSRMLEPAKGLTEILIYSDIFFIEKRVRYQVLLSLKIQLN